MFPTRLAASGLVAAFLAGCAAGPDYHRPAAPLAERFTMPAAADGAAAADLAHWWTAFNDPLLTHFVTAALAQNLDLAQATARVAQARAGLGAANAALLPSGAVNGSAARAYQSRETQLGRIAAAAPGSGRWGDAYEANLAASWEIDVAGGLRRGREAALADYQASAAGAVATRLAVAAQTADLYLGIRGLQARLSIARQQVAVRQDLAAKVRLLVDRGVAPRAQLQQSEGELAQAEALVPALETALDGAMNALDIMLGAPPGSNRAALAAPATLPAVPAMAETGSPADLLQRRPDLIAAERKVAAANARIGEAMAEYYPHLSLSALLGSATTLGAGSLFSSGASQQSALLGLRWRLFDFGRIDAQIAQAKGREGEALAAWRLAVLHAAEDVENSLSALARRQQQAAILGQGEQSLTGARAAAFAAYQNGAGSLIDVLHADQTLLQTADARAQTQTDALRAAVALYKALGGGWEAGAGVGAIAKR